MRGSHLTYYNGYKSTYSVSVKLLQPLSWHQCKCGKEARVINAPSGGVPQSTLRAQDSPQNLVVHMALPSAQWHLLQSFIQDTVPSHSGSSSGIPVGEKRQGFILGISLLIKYPACWCKERCKERSWSALEGQPLSLCCSEYHAHILLSPDDNSVLWLFSWWLVKMTKYCILERLSVLLSASFHPRGRVEEPLKT